MTVFLQTIHGSHLYGTNNSDSDVDFYIVHDGPNKQIVNSGIDNIYVNLNDFIKHVYNGQPMALEALWSRNSVIDDSYRPFFDALRPDEHKMRYAYDHVIAKFIEQNTFKSRLHALRLRHNLAVYNIDGKFDPTLPPEIVEDMKNVARDDSKFQFFLDNWF